VTLHASFLDRIDVNLSPFEQARFTFPTAGKFRYEVFDADFVESGQVLVTSKKSSTGDTVVVILEESVQPGHVVLPVGEMLGWLNLRDHDVRLVLMKNI